MKGKLFSPLKGDKPLKKEDNLGSENIKLESMITSRLFDSMLPKNDLMTIQESQGFVVVDLADDLKIQKDMLTSREDILKLIVEMYHSHVERECNSMERWRLMYGVVQDGLLTDKDKIPLILVATNLHKEQQLVEKELDQFNVEEDKVNEMHRSWKKKLLNEWLKYEDAACKKILQFAGLKEPQMSRMSMQTYRIWMYYWYNRSKEGKEVTDQMMKDSLVFKMLIMRLYVMSEKYRASMKDELKEVANRNGVEKTMLALFGMRYKVTDSQAITYRIFKRLMNELKLINLISEKSKKETFLNEIIPKSNSSQQKLLTKDANMMSIIMRKGLDAYSSLEDTDVLIFALLGYKTVVYSILHSLQAYKADTEFRAVTISAALRKSVDTDVLKILFNVKI